MIENAPIRFEPYFKTVIWGGDRIFRYKGLNREEPNIGESWEISAVPGHESVVAEGIYAGRNINDLVMDFGTDLLGRSVMSRYGANFPLLIKFIDARDRLSVQVHPDDRLAGERHGSLGKTEMWYIIDSDPGAKIYSGLNVEMTPQEYERRVADGTFAETLAEHDSHRGDVFFLPPGRVHAIGAGNLLAEIQESSDITYRIYDYGRRDAQGKTRELHTDAARDAIDFRVHSSYKNPRPSGSVACERLVECEHFITSRILLDGKLDLNLDFDSFAVLICLSGAASLHTPGGTTQLKQGSTVLLPAVMTSCTLSGNASLLLTNS